MVVNLEKEIIDQLGREIQHDIDNDILNAMMAEHYIQSGRSMVSLARFTSSDHAADIANWLAGQGIREFEDYFKFGSSFLFERAEDATMFRLKWI